MKFIGIWPDERKWNRPSSFYVLIPFLLMFCFVSVPMCLNLPLIADDFNLVIENLSMGNITFIISLIKIYVIWIHGKPMKCLVDSMARDWNTASDDSEHETMIVIARLTKRIIGRSIMLMLFVLFSFLVLYIYSAKFRSNKLFFYGYYFYNVSISPNYELTMLAQLLSIIYSSIGYTVVDNFVVMLILHVCAQLMNLRNQLKKFQGYDKQELEMKLKKIVRKHIYLNRFVWENFGCYISLNSLIMSHAFLRFVKTVENCCNVMLLIQMLGCTFQMCFQFLMVIMSLKDVTNECFFLQIFFMSGYLIYVMLQLYMYCYVGEKLSVESTELANAAYDSEWYNLSPRSAKLLIIIICRARTPLTITAGRFCSFSMQLFSQVRAKAL
ncbi:Gustatory and odorant receptor 7 [Eufriesea mexicana]|uniref:Odorant receptor n=1 Tax=Eufriesea mexicana TaxID=516756 RepID=A0A310SMR3_9HYME|nr:Gustatory and odorant receptor 7 [Eufriesea mexicana]